MSDSTKNQPRPSPPVSTGPLQYLSDFDGDAETNAALGRAELERLAKEAGRDAYPNNHIERRDRR